MAKKDKILYFVAPIFINLIIFFIFKSFISLNNMMNLFVLESVSYFIIGIFLFLINYKRKKITKINLIIMIILYFIIELFMMILFVVKGQYNVLMIKLIAIIGILLINYLMKRFVIFRRNNNVINFVKGEFNNCLFLLIYLLFSLFIFIKLCLNSNDINYVENRSSYKFKIPTINEILDNTFQDNFENSVIDQMPKNDLLKKIYNKLSVNGLFSILKFINFDKVDRYIALDKGIFLYKDYLVYNYQDEDAFKNNAIDDIEKINNISKEINANMYLYFVETDTNNKFDVNYNYDIISYLNSKLIISDDNVGVYAIDNFDNGYKDNFYKTDHHWNHKGSYNGYVDIAKMMYFDNFYKNDKEICFDKFSYRGSKAISLGGSGFLYDNVCIFDFKFPKFDITVGEEKLDDYGKSIDEIESGTDISYGSVYGGDYAEIVFDNQEVKNSKKLLIYSNSYSNAINKLLASNYETTYVIDGRFYEGFDMVSYVKDREIDDVLIVANSMLFWDNVDW